MGNREMLTYVPERYKEDMAAPAGRYLEVGKNIATAAGVACDLMHVEHEHPFEAMIDTAQNRGCDAIQMASHGRRGISAILLGSETLKVLIHSTIAGHCVPSTASSYSRSGFICVVVGPRIADRETTDIDCRQNGLGASSRLLKNALAADRRP
jgi:hypothetical protein